MLAAEAVDAAWHAGQSVEHSRLYVVLYQWVDTHKRPTLLNDPLTQKELCHSSNCTRLD